MSDSLGQRLKFARQERRLSVEQAAEATRIRPHYLQALEADDYSVMPSSVQARGFLRNYASFLGLDLQSILDELQAARPQEQVSGPLPQVDLAPSAPEAPERPAVEEPARPPLWRSWLGRLRRPEPSPEPDSVPVPPPAEEAPPAPKPVIVEEAPPPLSALSDEPTQPLSPAPLDLEPAPKPRGRRKKAEEAVEPPPPAQEPSTRKRRTKKVVEEVPAAQEPITRVRRKKKIEEPEPLAEPQAILPEPSEVEDLAAEPPQVESPAEAESPAVEAEQADVQGGGEVRPSLFARVGAWFASISARSFRKKAAPESAPEAETAQAEPSQTPEPPVQPAPEEAVVESAEPTETAEEIFAEIGGQLRKRRELLSLTLEEIERHTHVRAVFAKALEEGNFEQLPSMVQTRGMLTTYGTFLDLDTDALLLRFADALQAGHRARYPGKTSGERKPTLVSSTLPSLRSFMAGDVLYGLVIVLVMLVLVVWGLGRVFAQQAERVALPTAPSIADVLVGTPLPTSVQEVTLIPAADTPFALAETGTPEATLELPTPNLNINVALNIIAAERTYMRVLVDGQEVFNGRVLPGNAYPFEAVESIQVLTGNGAALRVTYNGRDMGLLGTFGEVADFIYTVDSIITPTPPAPPTASSTPNITATPSPTPSPTPTQPPAPTSTATPQS
ncbi:MAG: DUF4115 domain-containing protein [Chloroflexi bacterium]|nr:DUF4115 domain-containing protein [Chloroflexota bacterium]